MHTPQTETELAAPRRSVERGAPYGGPAWVEQIAERFGLQSSLRSPGRPRKPAVSDAETGGLFPT